MIDPTHHRSSTARLPIEAEGGVRRLAPGAQSTVAVALSQSDTRFAERQIGQILVETGALFPANLDRALTLQRRTGNLRLGEILVREHLCSEDALESGLALQQGAPKVRPDADDIDLALVDLLGADQCIRYAILPCRIDRGVTIVATSRPNRFGDIRSMLERKFGPVRMAIATPEEIESVLIEVRSTELAELAAARPDKRHSVRQWSPLWIAAGGLALPAMIFAAAWHAFSAVQFALTVLAVFMLVGMTALRLIAAIAAFDRRAIPRISASDTDVTPTISLLVPLLREADVSRHLIERLSYLDYPAERLDVCLVVEEDDHDTEDALELCGLPQGFRRIVVPTGQIRTKPRAPNYALDFCRGDIIGIYDAEDAPEPDQLRKVAARFATAPTNVACLQARLSFYNARQNWLSRCFALDYSAWFGVILPGLARAGFAIPLGGTGLFFRRAALEAAGRWDAHNVTEDADLGIRLARQGWRAEIIDSTVFEEANCRTLPWIRQRARWQKGYALTYAVHMRNPAALLRDLGLKRFLGVQIIFLGSLSLALLAPLLWTFWLVPLGFSHPVASVLSGTEVIWLIAIFLACEAVNICLSILGAIRTRQLRLVPWIPTLMLYAPLTTVSAFRALADLILRPFFWDKTAHGISMTKASGRTFPRSARDASRKRSRYGT